MVEDENFALHCLTHLNYYRLSAYRFPLSIQGDSDRFCAGITFNDLWNLYHFDRTLRRLLMDACKRVEISLRTQWAYVLSHRYGPQAYEISAVFKDFTKYKQAMVGLDEEIERSQEDFILHFRQKYGMHRPPIWAVTEVMTFGMASRLFENLKEPADRQTIADSYRLDEAALVSFLHHLTTVRNHAAHHSRVWNRKFAIKFAPPRKKPLGLFQNFQDPAVVADKEDRLIYNTLVMLVYLMQIIEPRSRWPVTLLEHILSLDTQYHQPMGFPPDWQARPIWRELNSGSKQQ